MLLLKLLPWWLYASVLLLLPHHSSTSPQPGRGLLNSGWPVLMSSTWLSQVQQQQQQQLCETRFCMGACALTRVRRGYSKLQRCGRGRLSGRCICV